MKEEYDVENISLENNNNKEELERLKFKTNSIIEGFDLLKNSIDNTKRELKQLSWNIETYDRGVDNIEIKINDLINILKGLSNGDR